MTKRLYPQAFSSLLKVIPLCLSILFLNTIQAQAKDLVDPDTIACSSYLFGTMSQKDCEFTCNKNGAQLCTKVKSYDGAGSNGKDLDCYACAIDQSCADIGAISFWDCFACEANPQQECILAGAPPAPFGLPGGGTGLGGKTINGEQCYKCVNKPDMCKATWPTSTWLGTCQANCKGKDETCVFKGMVGGNGCFECLKKPKEQCADIGLLSAAQCGPCNNDPATICQLSGFTKTFEACFKCIPKNNPPPPPPPTCAELGYPNDCPSCHAQGKGCQWTKIDDNLSCVYCVEPATLPNCSPDLNAWECISECNAKGGQCIGRTKQRGDPDCYYCYMPPAPKQGCAKYSMPASCTPNPCSSNEECAMVNMPGEEFQCATCEIKDIVDKQTICPELGYAEHCGVCYQAQQACKSVFITKEHFWCAQCFIPERATCDDAGLEYGPCAGDECPYGLECQQTMLKGVYCHSCGCPHGSRQGDCPGDCMEPDEICHQMAGGCYDCLDKPIEEPACPQGTTDGPCITTSCSSDQKCQEVDDDCHTCVAKNCHDYGKLNDCVVCDVAHPPQSCVDVSPTPGLNCKECKDRTIEEQCGDIQALPGVCGDSSCSSAENCVPAGKKCHNCVEKTCHDYGFLNDCVMCDVANPPQKCLDANPAPGLNCKECADKTLEENCEDQGALGGTCPGLCSTDQKCTPVGNKCHKCEERKAPVCPGGTQPGGCPGTCNSQEDCSFVNPDCHTCQVKTGTSCPEGSVKGPCPGNCVSKYEDCVVTAPGCHDCKEHNRKTCEDNGMSDGETCSQTCDLSKNICVQKGEDDYGTKCWACEPKPRTVECPQNQQVGACPGNCGTLPCIQMSTACYECQITLTQICPQGQLPGACPGSCNTETQNCVPGDNNCHQCQEKPRTGGNNCWDLGLMNGFDCDSCMRRGEDCVMTGDRSSLGFCYKCQERKVIEEQGCAYGTVKGTCPGSCSEDMECVQTGDCYSCKFKEKSCFDHDLLLNCLPCQWQGKECVDAPVDGLNCKQCKEWRNMCPFPYFPERVCEECEWDGGYCVPATTKPRFGSGMTQERGKPIPGCFDCVEKASCSDFGLRCDCATCPPGTVCLPTVVNLGYGEYMRCASCMKASTYVYLVYFVSTPIGRYILEGSFDPTQLGKLNASSVMGLLKVDASKAQQVQDAMSKVQGLSKGGGMATMGSLKDIAGQLQKTFSDKKAGFGENCFDKDFKPGELPKTPPSSPSQNKGAAAAPAKVGSDENEAAQVNAPMVSCGKVDGEEALNVFDASGTLIKTIGKKEIEGNPGSILDALTKADEASQKFLALKAGGWKGLVKSAASTLVDKIMGPREPEDKKLKAVELDPNDPLYFPTHNKKVSKVAERMKKVISNPLSSGIRMGGGELGGGATDPMEERKEEAAKIQDQWGIRKVGYLPKSDDKSAWNVIDGRAQNIVVAVIDSGLDMGHPDGPQYIWTNTKETPNNNIDDDANGYTDDVYGWNFLEENHDLTDYKGHGTFVAGIIAAKSNNGIGIAGINPGAVIMPLKVANENGETNDFHISRAIYYAVNHGARVINISLGARGVSPLEKSAINYAREMNVFVSVAAGNVGENIGDHGPASTPGVVSVGSMDFDGKRSTISNWGPNNGLIAPGEQIYSLRSLASFRKGKDSAASKEYYKMDGTSFASPMVAGTASLMLAKNPNLTVAEIESVLFVSATDMYDEGWDGESGAGLLNAAGALRMDPSNLLVVKITKIRANKDDKKKVTSVDVFGTVRGNFESYVVELGKGKNAGSFREVAGPFTEATEHGWVGQLNEADFRGSKEWIVRIKVKDKNGKDVIARVLFLL